jgi:hypothetical protein
MSAQRKILNYAKREWLVEQIALLVKDSHQQLSMEEMAAHVVSLVRAVKREDYYKKIRPKC